MVKRMKRLNNNVEKRENNIKGGLLGGGPPCFDFLNLSITAVLLSWDYLKNENALFSLTNRLPQEVLQNAFSSHHQRGGNEGDSTAKR